MSEKEEKDILPKRFFEAFKSGPLKDKPIKETEPAQSVETYYEMAGIKMAYHP